MQQSALFLSLIIVANCSAPYETPALKLIPQKAQTVLVIDIDAVRRSKLWEAWEEELEFVAPLLPGALKLASGALSLPLPEALDTLCLSFWWGEKRESVGVLTLKEPLDEKTLFSLATEYLGASVREHEGRRALSLSDTTSLVFADEKTLLIGSAEGLSLALKLAEGQGESVQKSPLLAALREKLPRGGAIWGFGEVPPSLRKELSDTLLASKTSGSLLGAASDLEAIEGWTSFVGMIDLREGIKGELHLEVASEEDAEKLGSSSFLTSALSLGGMFLGLSQMGSWFTFSWSGRDWRVKLAIPQGEANKLLRFSSLSVLSQEYRGW